MMGVFINRRRLLFVLSAGGLASARLLPGDREAKAADDEIDLAKVPVKVKEAAAKAVPRAQWTSASKSEDEGEVIYELEGSDAAQRYVWVEVTAKGVVNEVQTEIPFREVPAVVRAALKGKLPRFKATTTYEARQQGKVVRYDFEGKRPRDREEIGVSISADGKEVEIDAG
jgi:hypothetical protein